MATVRESTTAVTLHGKTLDLHVASPASSDPVRALVLYASGDGGWFGTAVDMFRLIAQSGYYAAGFSSRAFMRIERPHDRTLSPSQVATEYGRVLDRARNVLGLDATTPVVLAGWSRGAAFSVLAAGEPSLSSRPIGVVAIGLGEGEDFQINGGDDENDDGHAAVARRWPFEPYRRIADFGALPCAVIQSTHDQYLSAARARALLGPDAPGRRLYAVKATNHRFSGGRPAFDAAFRDALRWIVDEPQTRR